MASELGDESRRKKLAIGWLWARLLADVTRQVTRWATAADEQGAAVHWPARWHAAQKRGADHHHVLTRPVQHQGFRLGQGVGG